MSTLDQAMNYLADYHTFKKITANYPISIGSASSSWTTIISATPALATAKEVIVEIGGLNASYYQQMHFVQTASKAFSMSYCFIFDTVTSSNNLSSSYMASAEIYVDFVQGRVQARQLCKKSNGTQYYVHAVYYR